mgnify:CR=1 FL=1
MSEKNLSRYFSRITWIFHACYNRLKLHISYLFMIQMVESVGKQHRDLLTHNFGLLPFNRAVSKYNIDESVELDIVTSSRKVIDYKIARLIKMIAIDQSTRFQPIIGEAGSGKTHYYHILKDLEGEKCKIPFRVVYVSSPPGTYRLFHHIYSCLVDEIGDEAFFMHISNVILGEIGIDPRSISNKTDPNVLMAQILPTFPGIFADSIKCLMLLRIYGSRHPIGALALRWLLGECLTEDEQKILQIHSILEQDDVCLAMIKIICDLSGFILLFYFDEMESPYRTYGPEAQKKFFSYIKRLYNELRNSLIITACLKYIWEDIVNTADVPTLQRMEVELEFDRFNAEDLKSYYLRAMDVFWKRTGQISPSDEYYPLSSQILQNIYDSCEGNQRKCIKYINQRIEEEIFNFRVNRNTSGFLSGLKDAETHINKRSRSITRKLKRKSRKIIDADVDEFKEEREPTPGHVYSIVLKNLKDLLSANRIEHQIVQDHEIEIDGKKRKFSALLKTRNELIAIDIPSIKSFERSAGIAGFYSVKRLKEAIVANKIDKAIIISPDQTNGNKYNSILDQFNTILEIKIPCDKIREIVNDRESLEIDLKTMIKNIK